MTARNLSSDKNKRSEDVEKKKKAIYVQKYSKGLLAEAVLLAGNPVFLVSRNGIVSIESAIELENMLIKPLEANSYLSRPYSFASEEELKVYLGKTKSETVDTLFRKAKSICKKYIDADDSHISLVISDIIFTYYQDKMGLTHYLFFIGDNTSGKSNNLTVIHALAYRNLMSSDLTAANVYQFLGTQEEGQGTLCIDEADQIDSNIDLMRILKNGYTTGFPVARVDTSQGRTQDRFFTFGFKAFAAERLPDTLTAKGFNQRIVGLPCTYGNPQYDISEVINPAGEEEFQKLIDELHDFRNTLLIHRLIHFHEIIPNIQVNLLGRERQLFKPLVRVFQDCKTTLEELLPVVSNFVSQRRKSNSNTWHAFLYKLIVDLIQAQKSIELESHLIWETIKDVLPGEAISNRKLSYDSADFGTISQKRVIETLIQVFGARQSPNRREKRKLIFDIEKLKRLGRIYNLSIEVKVGTGVTDVTPVTDIGLDRYAIEAAGQTNKNEGQTEQEKDNTNNYNNNHNNNINTTSNITTEASSDRLHHTNNQSQEGKEKAVDLSALIDPLFCLHIGIID